jgi:DNA/RNA-binding domain of Phe-tRNA-synthetase-like protein
MFTAELRNMLLTAGHDLDPVKLPLTLGVSEGHEKYVRINGSEQELKAGDMIISDSEGVISSVIYGPDQRTSINPGTINVIFTVYAVPGISEQALLQHLQGIEANVRLIAPDCTTETLRMYSAD